MNPVQTRRHEILRIKAKEKSPTCYDPRPLEHCEARSGSVEKLRCELISLIKLISPVHFWTYWFHQWTKSIMIIPIHFREQHHQNYNKSRTPILELFPPTYPMSDEFSILCADTKAAMNVSLEERARIECKTQDQCRQQEWHIVRSKTITGSKCWRILCDLLY